MLRSLLMVAIAGICSLSSTGYGQSLERFFLQGDYLYWQTHLSGLESAFGTSTVVVDNTGPVAITRSYEVDIDPHFDWTSGFRIAAGALFECSCLEIDMVWTDFKNDGQTSTQGAAGIVNSGLCSISLDQLDTVLAYNYKSLGMLFKPFLGVRAAQIKQNVNSQVVTDITVLPATLALETRQLDDSQHLKAIGPILGLSGSYGLDCGFGIYGLASIGLLYGNYKIEFNDTDTFTAPYSKELIFVDRQHLHRFNGNLDLALGVYGRFCLAKKVGFELKIGFENHEYFNQSYLGVNRGDLSFNGLISSFIFSY